MRRLEGDATGESFFPREKLACVGVSGVLARGVAVTADGSALILLGVAFPALQPPNRTSSSFLGGEFDSVFMLAMRVSITRKSSGVIC